MIVRGALFLALGAVVGSVGLAQQPESRPADVVAPSSPSTLPPIDLPEFVITGVAPIDPPPVDKEFPEEDGTYRHLPTEQTNHQRERGTTDLGTRFKQSLHSTSENFHGRVGALAGSFFTTDIFASFGQSEESHSILGNAQYGRTRGFTRHADASSGGIALSGSLLIRSGHLLLDNARASGRGFYDRSKYKFYGARRPVFQRDLTSAGVAVRGETSTDAPIGIRGGMDYRTFVVNDSTASTTENLAILTAGTSVPVFEVPIEVTGSAHLATVSAKSSANVSSISLAVGSPAFHWNDLLLRVSATGWIIKGMAGQTGSYFYPHASVRYLGVENHVFFLDFEPSVGSSLLFDHIHENPYLSASSAIRHSLERWVVKAGSESEWTKSLSTRAEFEYRAIDGYPLFADSSSSGIWTLAYGGRTTIAGVNLRGVANITTNDYFAVALSVRSAKNSMYGNRIPSVPDFEASVLYRYRFPQHLSVGATLSYLGARRSSAASGETSGSCVWSGVTAEYSGLSRVALVLEVRNALNRRYEVWKGYRAEPLSIALGVSYRW